MEPAENELRCRAILAARERQRAEYARIGWHEIVDESEVAALFERFVAAFFPGDRLCVPAPFFTWDVTRATGLAYRSSEQRFLLDDLHRKCLPALKRCGVKSQPWFVLQNIHHPCYRLHFDEMPDHLDEWPVELLPSADPCYLLAADFSSGIIAEMRESITVFGIELLAAINKNQPAALTHIVRSAIPNDCE